MVAEAPSIVFSAFSAVSLVSSVAIVLTGFLFPSLMLSPKSRPFSYIVFMISLCDMIADFGMVIGYANNGTWQCSFQSVMYLYFFPASWLWITILVYQLRCLIIDKHLWLTVPSMHAICWSFPLLTLLLPVATGNGYGNLNGEKGNFVCGIGGSRDPGVGLLLFFYSTGIVCGLCAAYWMYESYLSCIKSGAESELALYQITRLYPIAMLICWLPSFTFVVCNGFDESACNFSSVGYQPLEILKTQNGTMMVIIFFVYSHQARYRWYELFIDTPKNVSQIEPTFNIRAGVIRGTSNGDEYDEKLILKSIQRGMSWSQDQPDPSTSHSLYGRSIQRNNTNQRGMSWSQDQADPSTSHSLYGREPSVELTTNNPILNGPKNLKLPDVIDEKYDEKDDVCNTINSDSKL